MSGLVGSVSSADLLAADTGSACDRREEAEPTRSLSPELTLAIARAQRAWAKKYAPWLLEEWLA